MSFRLNWLIVSFKYPYPSGFSVQSLNLSNTEIRLFLLSSLSVVLACILMVCSSGHHFEVLFILDDLDLFFIMNCPSLFLEIFSVS